MSNTKVVFGNQLHDRPEGAQWLPKGCHSEDDLSPAPPPGEYITVDVVFQSGYEVCDIVIDREDATTSEYWTLVTDLQNPYDSSDEIVSVDGRPADEDGAWLAAVDEKLIATLGLIEDDLYA